MSHTTEADYKKQIEDLRELHRQAVESAQQAAEETLKAHDQLAMANNEKDLVDAELAALKLQRIPVTSFNTPVPRTNISNQLQTAGYIDRQMLNDAFREFTNEALEREDRMSQNMTALIMSSLQNNAIPPSNVSYNVSQNPSNVAPQPNAPQSFNLAASTSPAPSSYLAASTSSLPHVPSTNYDYDKSVEVEQRKIINPDTTPTSIRLWLILFDIYSKHPNRLLSMTEAFGEKALMTLRFMFPDEHIPTDETGFREFLNRHFLTTTNLFSDIIVYPKLSNAAPKPQIVSPNLSNVAPLPTAPQSLSQSQEPAQPIYYPTIFICGSEYNISYPPQTINNVPAESTSPSSSQRADREQASAQAPRIERVGEYSNENTPSSSPHTQ